MDDQNQQPPARVEPTSPQPVVAPVPAAVVPQQQTEKPKLDVSDEAAQALLMFNGVQASQKPKAKLPITLIISIIVLILLAILSNALLGKAKSTSGSTSSSNATNSGATNQSGNAPSSSVDSQINQDVNSCTNPVNAVSSC